MQHENKVSDLINYSIMQKPLDFQQTFSEIITDRLQTAITDKKMEIAQSMFGSSDSPFSDYENSYEEE